MKKAEAKYAALVQSSKDGKSMEGVEQEPQFSAFVQPTFSIKSLQGQTRSSALVNKKKSNFFVLDLSFRTELIRMDDHFKATIMNKRKK